MPRKQSTPPPDIGELRFLYIGTDNTERDVAQYVDVLGATLRWRFQHFDADVAALAVGDGPLLLFADHRPAGSILPIYAVEDLRAATKLIKSRGGAIAEGPLGTPEGDCVIISFEGGGEIALLQVDRPGAMDGAFADESNQQAVRE